LFERKRKRLKVMKFLLASLVANTVGVLLVAFIAPAAVSAQETQIPGRPNDFTIPNGGTFVCDFSGSKCGVTGDFDSDDISIEGGLETNVAAGLQWTALDIANDVLTVGVCTDTTGDDCIVTCNYGCTCTQPDGVTECPFMVVTLAPTLAPSVTMEEMTSAPAPSGSDDSGAGSWQSSTSTEIALVIATFVSALVGL
jgi:hypothetical protein